MQIETITSRYRNDFWAIYRCEFCGTAKRSYGYEDANFHFNVIPAMKCDACEKASNDNTSADTLATVRSGCAIPTEPTP